MGKKFEKTKETKKTVFYENDDYKIKLQNGGYVQKQNEPYKHWYVGDEQEGDYFDAKVRTMFVTNKYTGKTASSRVYQPNPVQDFENDLDSKQQFKSIHDKIDYIPMFNIAK